MKNRYRVYEKYAQQIQSSRNRIILSCFIMITILFSGFLLKNHHYLSQMTKEQTMYCKQKPYKYNASHVGLPVSIRPLSADCI